MIEIEALLLAESAPSMFVMALVLESPPVVVEHVQPDPVAEYAEPRSHGHVCTCSIAFEADQSSFQLYSSGMLTASWCAWSRPGVLAVGYGINAGADCWKVTNSC